MRYQIMFTPEAIEDYDDLSAQGRSEVRDPINAHLLHTPAQESKSRIKRLRNLAHPQYRLRVGDLRVFYDIIEDEVVVLGIVEKSATEARLKKWSI